MSGVCVFVFVCVSLGFLSNLFLFTLFSFVDLVCVIYSGYLVRAPNSRSGGREFKSPVWHELGALTT